MGSGCNTKVIEGYHHCEDLRRRKVLIYAKSLRITMPSKRKNKALLQGQQSAISFLVQILYMNSNDNILGVRHGKDLLDKQMMKTASLFRLGSPELPTPFFGTGLAEDVEFEFDNTIINSKVYRPIMALVREVVNKRRRPQSITNLKNISFDSKAQSRNFLAPISEGSNVGRRAPAPISDTDDVDRHCQR